MIANKAACLAFTIAEEGGFVNDPRDPGGATKYGISLTTLRRWMGDAFRGVASVFNLTPSKAAAIYTRDYWPLVHGDDLPAGVDLMAFDFGVTAGPRLSVELLQAAVGVATDGIIGRDTMRAIAGQSPATLIAALQVRQSNHYRALDDFSIFGGGWIARTKRRAALAQKMAAATAKTPVFQQ